MKLFRTKRPGTTAQVQDSLLERFPGNADGQSVKVYLYILHHIDEPLTDSQIADATGLTDRDVRYALAKWAREGELEWVEVDNRWKEDPETEIKETRGMKTTGDILVERIEDTLGFRLTGEQKGYLLHLSGAKGISTDVLLDTAKKIAEKRNALKGEWEDSDWFILFTRTALSAPAPEKKASEKGQASSGQDAARNNAAAQAGSTATDNQMRPILNAIGNAFGIDASSPGSAEKELIAKWMSYGYGAEVISHACARAKLSAGKVSWTYADKILGGWHDDNVTTIEEADAHEERRQKERKKTAGGRRPTTGFHNLEERDDDLEAWALKKTKMELGLTDGSDTGNGQVPQQP